MHGGASPWNLDVPEPATLFLPDTLCDFDSVREIEEPLDHLLIAQGLGEVVGGGIGKGWYRFELEVVDFDASLRCLAGCAGELRLPPGSLLRDAAGRDLAVSPRSPVAVEESPKPA